MSLLRASPDPISQVASWYHVVIFTASVQEYADPVIDWLDQGRGLIGGRMFREVSVLPAEVWNRHSRGSWQACTYRNGSYLKDLALVDQDLSRVCLVDNSPMSYLINPGASGCGRACDTTLTLSFDSKRHSDRRLDPRSERRVPAGPAARARRAALCVRRAQRALHPRLLSRPSDTTLIKQRLIPPASTPHDHAEDT